MSPTLLHPPNLQPCCTTLTRRKDLTETTLHHLGPPSTPSQQYDNLPIPSVLKLETLRLTLPSSTNPIAYF
ncbi:hypothetical protein ACOSQ2_017480 [Xanthoceras sorbifolium]